jgi:hypothetical protein
VGNKSSRVKNSFTNSNSCNTRNTFFKNTTPQSRVLLEKLTTTQLLMNFPTSYGIRRFIAMFTRAHCGKNVHLILIK